uniref:Uncharacterized protein n=1 Tax=Triticum urartu TaxID=4572 RepID=A0A8R7QSN8_TRIUA
MEQLQGLHLTPIQQKACHQRVPRHHVPGLHATEHSLGFFNQPALCVHVHQGIANEHGRAASELDRLSMHAPPELERALARHRGEDARERERVRPYPLGAHPEEERHGVRVRPGLRITSEQRRPCADVPLWHPLEHQPPVLHATALRVRVDERRADSDVGPVEPALDAEAMQLLPDGPAAARHRPARLESAGQHGAVEVFAAEAPCGREMAQRLPPHPAPRALDEGVPAGSGAGPRRGVPAGNSVERPAGAPGVGASCAILLQPGRRGARGQPLPGREGPGQSWERRPQRHATSLRRWSPWRRAGDARGGGEWEWE